MFANGLNMMRAALFSISFFGFYIFKFTKSFSMKKERWHALYFLLCARAFSINVILCVEADILFGKFRIVCQPVRLANVHGCIVSRPDFSLHFLLLSPVSNLHFIFNPKYGLLFLNLSWWSGA